MTLFPIRIRGRPIKREVLRRESRSELQTGGKPKTRLSALCHKPTGYAEPKTLPLSARNIGAPKLRGSSYPLPCPLINQIALVRRFFIGRRQLLNTDKVISPFCQSFLPLLKIGVNIIYALDSGKFMVEAHFSYVSWNPQSAPPRIALVAALPAVVSLLVHSARFRRMDLR